MSDIADNGDDQPLAPWIRAALLVEGLEGGPSPDQRARMAGKLAAAVGVSAATLLGAKVLAGAKVAGSAGSAAATAGKAAALSGKTAAIVVGTVLVAGGVGVTVGELHGRSEPPRTATSTPVSPPVALDDAESPIDSGQDASAPDAVVIDAPVDAAPHATGHRPDGGRQSDQIARERELIDVARSALRAGDTRLATKSLVEHELRFPAGKLTEERRALAIEVAIVAGDRAKAQKLAAEFRTAYPHSVFQARIDDLVK